MKRVGQRHALASCWTLWAGLVSFEAAAQGAPAPPSSEPAPTEAPSPAREGEGSEGSASAEQALPAGEAADATDGVVADPAASPGPELDHEASLPEAALPTEPPDEGAAEPEPEATDPDVLLAQLEAELAQSDSASDVPNLRLYGFADFSFYKYFIHESSALRSVLYPNAAFAVGNLNLYLASELGEGWQSLIEVRFTYLPNGNRVVVGSDVERTDTDVQDYTNLARPRQVGGVMIERAWLEYAADPLFVIRGGSWLTPYGIWNEDHGSPTIIPVVRPYVIGLELLPERQTGLQIHGVGHPSDDLSLGYALGVSNGRGQVQDYADLDENKALTTRVYGSYRGAGTLDFGASVYLGRYTDLRQTATLAGAGVRIDDVITEQYDEFAWGVDARYTHGGFHTQAEFIVAERAFTQAGRPERIPGQFQPDNRPYGGYLVTGYRFDWLGLMPYVTAEYFELTNVLEPTRPATNDVIVTAAVGLNSRPTHNVTLKLEGIAARFYGDIPEGSAFSHSSEGLQAQAAWAF